MKHFRLGVLHLATEFYQCPNNYLQFLNHILTGGYPVINIESILVFEINCNIKFS